MAVPTLRAQTQARPWEMAQVVIPSGVMLQVTVVTSDRGPSTTAAARALDICARASVASSASPGNARRRASRRRELPDVMATTSTDECAPPATPVLGSLPDRVATIIARHP